jgi:hypothetical protein
MIKTNSELFMNGFTERNWDGNEIYRREKEIINSEFNI